MVTDEIHEMSHPSAERMWCQYKKKVQMFKPWRKIGLLAVVAVTTGTTWYGWKNYGKFYMDVKSCSIPFCSFSCKLPPDVNKNTVDNGLVTIGTATHTLNFENVLSLTMLLRNVDVKELETLDVSGRVQRRQYPWSDTTLFQKEFQIHLKPPFTQKEMKDELDKVEGVLCCTSCCTSLKEYERCLVAWKQFVQHDM